MHLDLHEAELKNSSQDFDLKITVAGSNTRHPHEAWFPPLYLHRSLHKNIVQTVESGFLDLGEQILIRPIIVDLRQIMDIDLTCVLCRFKV